MKKIAKLKLHKLTMGVKIPILGQVPIKHFG